MNIYDFSKFDNFFIEHLYNEVMQCEMVFARSADMRRFIVGAIFQLKAAAAIQFRLTLKIVSYRLLIVKLLTYEFFLLILFLFP